MRLFGLEISRRKSAVSAMTVANSPGLVGNGGWFGAIREGFAGAFQRSITVETTPNILAFSAVYAAIALISSDISKLRFKLVRASGEVWSEVHDHDLVKVLRKPNRYQTRNQFLQQWIVSLLLCGNTYVYKERDASGLVIALYILDSRKVKPVITQDGDVYYACSSDWLTQMPEGEAAAVIHQYEIIHDRCFAPFHPLCGLPPIYACGASATLGIRVQTNSEQFFANMSRPSGHLTTPGMISDAQAERLKAQFEQNFSGTNIGRLLVTDGGMKYEQMTIPAHDAQLIEQLKFTCEDIARAFRVPLHKLGLGTPTLNNVAALNQDYYSQTLQSLIEAIESLMDEAFDLPSNLGIELDLDGLLRMDPVSAADVQQKLVAGSIASPNEARAKFNLPPVDGGDAPLSQQQYYSLQALAKRNLKDDPFAMKSFIFETDNRGVTLARAVDAPQIVRAEANLDALAVDCGLWTKDQEYTLGSIVEHSGRHWKCRDASTTEEPGHGTVWGYHFPKKTASEPSSQGRPASTRRSAVEITGLDPMFMDCGKWAADHRYGAGAIVQYKGHQFACCVAKGFTGDEPGIGDDWTRYEPS